MESYGGQHMAERFRFILQNGTRFYAFASFVSHNTAFIAGIKYYSKYRRFVGKAKVDFR